MTPKDLNWNSAGFMLKAIENSATEKDKSLLLERQEALRTVADLVRAVTTGGEGRALLIEGAAGVGRTALLDRLLATAAPRSQIATARGSELERDLQFGVVLNLLAPLVDATQDRDALFTGPAGLARSLFEQAIPPAGRDRDLALMHGLYSLCANLAEDSPLVLAIDDAQWADHDSLRFIAYLLERIAGLRILLAVSRRSGRESATGPFLESIKVRVDGAVIHLDDLSRQASLELIERRLGEIDEQAGESCWRLTGGNPFLLGELLSFAIASDPSDPGSWLVPESAARIMALRFIGLDVESRMVARALSVLDESVTRGEIEEILECGPTTVFPALDRLIQSGLLEPGPGFRYRHPLLRNAVSDSMNAGERDLLNLRAASVIRQRDPVQAAIHLIAARPEGPSPEEWVVRLLAEGASSARERGASEKAITLLRRLLTERLDQPRRYETLLTLGELEAENRDPLAVDHLTAAAELTDSPINRASIALTQGKACFHLGRLEQASEICRAAIADLEDTERELRLALEATALDSESLLGIRRERPTELAAEVEGATTPGERLVFAHVLADQAATGSAPAKVIRTGGRRLIEQDFLDEAGAASPVYIYLGTALAWAGALDEVLALTTLGLENGNENGSAVTVAYSAALRAGVALLAGDLDLAEQDSKLVVTDMWAADPMAYAVALAWYIEVAVLRGDLVRGREALERSGLTGGLPELGTIDFLMLARGSLALAEGNPDQALTEYLAVGERVRRARYPNPAAMDWRSRAAELLWEAGDTSRAMQLATEELELVEAFGAPRAIGVALRAFGKVAGGKSGLEALERSRDLLKAVSPVEEARSTIALGNLLHREGKEARETLYRGMDLAHHAGARILVEQAMGSLRETGARPRRPSIQGTDSLTPQEERVAGMAASGLTNREIAEQLFLTRRTVELHLSNVYSKLSIKSRRELPGFGEPAT